MGAIAALSAALFDWLVLCRLARKPTCTWPRRWRGGAHAGLGLAALGAYTAVGMTITERNPLAVDTLWRW